MWNFMPTSWKANLKVLGNLKRENA
jgi:hypothetical protein